MISSPVINDITYANMTRIDDTEYLFAYFTFLLPISFPTNVVAAIDMPKVN